MYFLGTEREGREEEGKGRKVTGRGIYLLLNLGLATPLIAHLPLSFVLLIMRYHIRCYCSLYATKYSTVFDNVNHISPEVSLHKSTVKTK